MKNLKSYIVFFVAFLSTNWLSGCTTTSPYMSHNFSQKKFQSNQKSVVLLKGYRSYKALDGELKQGPVSVVIKNIDLPAVEYKLNNANDFSIMMLESGTYVIDKITWSNGVQIKYSVDPGILADNTISYGAFRVNPGEVAYVGTLKIKDRANKFYIDYKNELDSAEQYLQSSKFSNLSKKLQYKSMQVKNNKLNS